MDHALVYIDDILLYNPNQKAHTELLQRFKQLVLHHEIMLFKRKIQINKDEIEFLGMQLKDGKYQPGKHIAEELLKFS